MGCCGVSLSIKRLKFLIQSSPARPTSHSPVSAHFVSSAESPDISEGCQRRCCLGVVSRGLFRLHRLIAPRWLWATDLFSWRSKGRDGRDRFAVAETVSVCA